MIELDINESDRVFIIRGDIARISENRRAKYYLEDYLDAYETDGCIKIPYSDESVREKTLKKVQNALLKYSIEIQDSDEIKHVLDHYYQELKDFSEFSRKAKLIWNNDVDTKEFLDFKESVQCFITNRTLYPKQFLAAYHLAFSQNACNFSVPGAGKTSIVYAAYSYLSHLPPANPKHVNKLLIIGPLSSFAPWELEFEECFGRPVRSKRLSGGVSLEEREKHLLAISEAVDSPELTLMSYQSVPSNLNNLILYLSKPQNRVMVVLDEAHKIKNVDRGIWAESVMGIAKYCASRIVLTGTPIPNGYEDIYNLYEFIWPDKEIINFNVFQLKDMSENRFDSRVSQLIDNISPFFIRIKKSDLDLPPTINHTPESVRMSDVQREIYTYIESEYVNYFIENQNDLIATSELTKARFVRLMQAATNPGLLRQPLEDAFSDHDINNSLYFDDTNVIAKILNYKELEPVPQKFIKAKEIAQECIARGEKVIIWGTFILNIRELQIYFQKNGIKSELLIGETPIETDSLASDVVTREKIIREFHNEDCPYSVIIANPLAVAESISLHKACHHAIYLERTFNAANFIQSKDRIHRVGLPPGVATHYHFILSENSIDETIHRRLVEKEERMLELIESREIPLFSENLDFDIDLSSDVKAIIRDYVGRSSTI